MSDAIDDSIVHKNVTDLFEPGPVPNVSKISSLCISRYYYLENNTARWLDQRLDVTA